MPATIITREPLEAGLDDAAIDTLIGLRLKAGAIRCWVEGTQLLTEWNVFGEQ